MGEDQSDSRVQITLDRETHIYSRAGVDIGVSVTVALQMAGVIEPYPVEAMAAVEHARELGEIVHEWCEWLDRENFEDEAYLMTTIEQLRDSEPLGYVAAYQAFVLEHKPAWTHIEVPHTREDIAGTPDRIGYLELNGERVPAIIDIKTAKQIKSWWQIQLTAYQWLAEILECRLFAVWLHPDGSFDLLPYESAENVWQCVLGLVKWQIAAGRKLP